MLSKSLNYTSKSFHKLLLCFVFQRAGFSVYPGFLELVLQTRLAVLELVYNFCCTAGLKLAVFPCSHLGSWSNESAPPQNEQHSFLKSHASSQYCNHKGLSSQENPPNTHTLYNHTLPPNQSCSPPLQCFISETLEHLTPCC